MKKVLVAQTEAEARTAAYLLVETGTENVAVLAGGWPAFAGSVLSPAPPVDEGRYAPVVERFREQARATLAEMMKAEAAAGTKAPKKVKKVQGGLLKTRVLQPREAAERKRVKIMFRNRAALAATLLVCLVAGSAAATDGLLLPRLRHSVQGDGRRRAGAPPEHPGERHEPPPRSPS